MTTQKLEIRLNANGVAAPAQRAAWQCNEIVAFCLEAIKESDLTERPQITSPSMAYRFDGPDLPAGERLVVYENWLLSKGFHELARGVRETLEEARVFIELVRFQATEMTWGEFQDYLAALRERVGRLPFPALLGEVNVRLTSPMDFADEFMSFQKVRNCMEHRAGIVGPPDVGPEQRLTLKLPRLKMFYNNPAGEEVELVAGTVIDTHQHTGIAEILIKRDTRSKSYALGETVSFTAAEFNEFAFACYLFGSDVASKLPILLPAERP
ncbi:hypothetical protein [Rhodopseudomonas sp. BR0M22]|uniref:hypothetical protein n=1 Tax=Rhodopseudomonas sp. BR0M22 TaxID=2269369 RepID=UPI0013DEFF5F|nr:hypothetical protein [Rhodopseudomonas sp. BR0M22]